MSELGKPVWDSAKNSIYISVWSSVEKFYKSSDIATVRVSVLNSVWGSFEGSICVSIRGEVY